MNKEIDYLVIGFENCEAIKVPFKCFKDFKIDFNTDEKGREFAEIVDFIIVNNGDLEYVTTWSNNYINPISRLNESHDISTIRIHYKDFTHKIICTLWHEGDSNFNRYQKTGLLDYKTIHIEIKPLTVEEKIEIKLKKMNTRDLAKSIYDCFCPYDCADIFEFNIDHNQFCDDECSKCWNKYLD